MMKQRPGSNASEVIKNVKTRMAELKGTSFPPGMTYNISYDVSRFLDASIHEVLKTLVEAFLLVFIVVFHFFAGFSFHADSCAGCTGRIDRLAVFYATVWVFHQSAHACLHSYWPSASWWTMPL